jgi:hypothetical protein
VKPVMDLILIWFYVNIKGSNATGHGYGAVLGC